MSPVRTKLNRQQIVGFWAAWSGWLLDGMDSVIYALVLAPALNELLPRSGIAATPATVGFSGSVLFAVFLAGWGFSFSRPNFPRHYRADLFVGCPTLRVTGLR